VTGAVRRPSVPLVLAEEIQAIVMTSDVETIHIIGGGAIGCALAVHLSRQGRAVVLVRTTRSDVAKGRVRLVVQSADAEATASVDTVSLDRLGHLPGLIVVTAKSYANQALAAKLSERGASTPIVVLQNGLGVEAPFLAGGSADVYRCVLFATSEKQMEDRYTFRSIKPSPIGVIRGDAGTLRRIVRLLDTPGFRFVEDERIQETIWTKAIINAVFNSICPLLDIDNGIFDRSEAATETARAIIDECVAVAASQGMRLAPEPILRQLLTISRTATGQAISTLQDIRRGNPTEIGSLNLEIARIGDEASPPVRAERTRLLGRMVELKATLRRQTAS
jgi:2-dehydropantoate 2-reductase